MQRIRMYQAEIKKLQGWLNKARKKGGCPRYLAEIRLEMAQCRLTIAAIRYGLSLGYGKK